MSPPADDPRTASVGGSQVDARTWGAVWCTLDEVAGPTDAGASAVAAWATDLSAVGVHVAVCSAHAVDAVDRRLRLRPVGRGWVHLVTDGGAALHRCGPDGVSPEAPDGVEPADGLGRLARLLDRSGIGAGLVLLVGPALAAAADAVPALRRAVATAVQPCPPDRAAAQLERIVDAQLRRHAQGRVPDVDPDPAWVLRLPVPRRAADRAVQETLCALSDGRLGTRGWLEDQPSADPGVHAAGVYTDVDGRRTLLAGPGWTALPIAAQDDGRRLLDLRTGVLLRESPGGLRSLRFASCVRPGVVALRAEADRRLVTGPALVPVDADQPGGRRAAVTSTRGGGITAVAVQSAARTVERIAAYAADPVRVPADRTATDALDEAARVGFDALLGEHRRAWARRWADAVVTIEGDPDAQRDLRFALFHLLSAAPDAGEAAVGARGTSGPAYDGHVFWDADVYVLPVLAAVRPAAARAMLQYRVARVDAARRRAAAMGCAGALWPWESTDDGEDVTPTVGQDRNGRPVPIRTGTAEVHIVADVAWAAVHYARWTGDDAFLRGDGLPLVVDGARYWRSRAEHDSDGSAHIRGVIGPDEYHELVDDNAFTNVMARWQLRTAADLADRCAAAPSRETAAWRSLADALVDGYDPATGRHEQFAGFSALTPLRIADVARPPIAADLLLGRDVVQASQVVKQADVVLLHHLVPGEVRPGTLGPDLYHYDPRTAHGSSLSPAVQAAVWARAGRPDRALDLLRIALRLDLDDVTGTTAGGLHLATMGGAWQAVVRGFLGVRVDTPTLAVDPVLPAAWQAVEAAVRFRGARVTIRADHHRVEVTCDRPTSVAVAGGGPVIVGPGGHGAPLPRRAPESP